jgi:hypothetical protein
MPAEGLAVEIIWNAAGVSIPLGQIPSAFNVFSALHVKDHKL